MTDLHPLRAALPSALVALDFYGTLAPISPHPDDARPLEGVLPVLRDVRATGAALAVVTGRSVASLLRVSGFGAVRGIVIYGLHGVERWEDGRLRAPAPPPGLPELRLRLPGLLAVAVSPSGRGPLAELADVTVPDPHSLISLLRQIVGGRVPR